MSDRTVFYSNIKMSLYLYYRRILDEMKYRSRTEIIATILNSARQKITKTRLMYMAYLSPIQLKEYLPSMLEQGMIQYDEAEKTFTLTQKGWQLLHTFDDMYKLISLQTKIVNK